MSKKRAHIERVDPTMYEGLYPARLTQADLAERQPLSLLVRSAGREYQAYRLSINIEAIQRNIGRATFNTILLDEDYHPATRSISSTLDEANNWFAPSFALIDNDRTISTRHGFLVSPQPDKFDELLVQATSLDLNEYASVM